VAQNPLTSQVPPAHGERSFWRRLTHEERVAFTRVAVGRSHPKGATLIQAGAADHWVAVIWSGRVRVVGGGSAQVIAVRGGGDIIGEQALIDGQPRSATVVAETPVRLLLFDSAAVTRLVASFPRVQQELTAILSERLREFDDRLAGRTGDAFARVVRFLVAQVDGADRIVHIGTQAALGARLGVSRDSVIRTLGRLRGERIVTTERGRVVVRDPDRLRDLLTG
jgi:CRP/FNR family transcriptional regulator, cyclic AMP receptor protein